MMAWETKHGMRHTAEYAIWNMMKARCYNKNNESYKYYGARGITVCDEWKASDGFAAFIEDMGMRPSDRHSIGRSNSNSNYEPDNCYWETIEDQSRNKRSNVIITFNGKSKCLTDWAIEMNINPSTLRSRIKKWPIEFALNLPKNSVWGKRDREAGSKS